ncbi:MAG: 16S rRNA (guanine(966)-N(2))-methyltransferase RsmD [Oscillospiraceae bacterium]|nr:16S rRNA (guanine(966)-N(2))-methyltransferase RsmD [Oscillospiraceae bacterium]
MRIITGSARGRKLTAPEGLTARPTTEMVKEAVFSAVHFEVPGARVLDLFAGSGQMGLEALSRGAASAVFVENARICLEAVRGNVEACGFQEKGRVLAMDAVSYIQSSDETFDIAFLDPPYRQGLVAAVLPHVAERMSDRGVIICETDRGEELPEAVGGFVLSRVKRYSKTKVHFYRRPENEE